MRGLALANHKAADKKIQPEITSNWCTFLLSSAAYAVRRPTPIRPILSLALRKPIKWQECWTKRIVAIRSGGILTS